MEADYAWGRRLDSHAARNALTRRCRCTRSTWIVAALADDPHGLPVPDLAPALVGTSPLGFTRIELLPSWSTRSAGRRGYSNDEAPAPTRRYGDPEDFMALVDKLRPAGHRRDPRLRCRTHLPNDEHGLAYFDGTHLYEHADPRQGFHPDWRSAIFNYGRNEVRSFLTSSACHWLDAYHADGIRVDAVASMLYLDYSRRAESIPNAHGGRENRDAIEFMRRLNRRVYAIHPDVQMIAEVGQASPMVSRPIEMGGLGFGLKWDIGPLDARHARVLRERSRPPQPPPGRADVPRAVRVHRELHASALTRRGRARQGLPDRPHAR